MSDKEEVQDQNTAHYCWSRATPQAPSGKRTQQLACLNPSVIHKRSWSSNMDTSRHLWDMDVKRNKNTCKNKYKSNQLAERFFNTISLHFNKIPTLFVTPISKNSDKGILKSNGYRTKLNKTQSVSCLSLAAVIVNGWKELRDVYTP